MANDVKMYGLSMGNSQEIYRINIRMCLVIFTIRLCNFMENIWPKAPFNYSASFWTSNFSDRLWEKPKSYHVQDLWIFGRVHE